MQLSFYYKPSLWQRIKLLFGIPLNFELSLAPERNDIKIYMPGEMNFVTTKFSMRLL